MQEITRGNAEIAAQIKLLESENSLLFKETEELREVRYRGCGNFMTLTIGDDTGHEVAGVDYGRVDTA
jgi:hypothetical protein